MKRFDDYPTASKLSDKLYEKKKLKQLIGFGNLGKLFASKNDFQRVSRVKQISMLEKRLEGKLGRSI